MATLASSAIHFQCSFLLDPGDGVADPLREIVRDVARWVNNAISKGTWGGVPAHTLYEGTNFQRSGIVVLSELLQASGNQIDLLKPGNEQKEYWAMYYVRPDTKINARRWISELGITKFGNNRLRVVLSVAHALREGYLGELPPIPTPNSPRLVRELLNSPNWRPVTRWIRLASTPTEVSLEGAETLVNAILDPTRIRPLILFGYTVDAVGPLSPQNLSSLLAGTTQVFTHASPDAQMETMRLLPTGFECAFDQIRVYEPRVQQDRFNEPKRHRFISNNDIKMRGEDALVLMLVQGIARRPLHYEDMAAASLQDIEHFARLKRLESLKAGGSEGDKEELLKLYEEEYKTLTDGKAALSKQLDAANESTLQLEYVRDEMSESVRKLEYEKRAAWSQIGTLQGELNEARGSLDVLQNISELPKTFAEAVTMIEKLHPHSLTFTERGRKSIEDADFDDVKIGWNCLYSVATVLHSLYFDHELSTSEICTEFRSRTGYELSMTEGSLTKSDHSLRNLRLDTYDGKDINIAAHVKAGPVDKKYLRVYFAADRTSKKIVIGHCGNHLDTAGTRRR